MSISLAVSTRERAWLGLLWAWGLALVVAGIVKVRVGWEAPHVLDLVGTYGPTTKDLVESWANKGAHLLIGFACVWLVLVDRGPVVRGWSLVVLAGFLGQVAATLLGGVFGAMPGMNLGALLWPVVLVAFARQDGVRAEILLGGLQRVARAICLASLAAWVIWPAWVVQFDYRDTWLPGMDFRLHGLMGHGHQLATMAFVLLALALVRPGRWRWADLVMGAVIIAAAQSKQFVALALLLPGAWLLIAPPAGLRRWTLGLRLGMVAGGLGLLLLAFLSLPEPAHHLVPADQRENMETLTGRTLIWRETLGAWEQSPWVGNGPRLWKDEMAERFEQEQGWVVPHAHNQFLQSLGQSGIIGALFLIAAQCGLTWGLWRNRSVAPLLLPGVLILIWLRGLIEPYFTPNLQDAGQFLVLASWKIAAARKEDHDL
jgi:hypothetical protein